MEATNNNNVNEKMKNPVLALLLLNADNNGKTTNGLNVNIISDNFEDREEVIENPSNEELCEDLSCNSDNINKNNNIKDLKHIVDSFGNYGNRDTILDSIFYPSPMDLSRKSPERNDSMRSLDGKNNLRIITITQFLKTVIATQLQNLLFSKGLKSTNKFCSSSDGGLDPMTCQLCPSLCASKSRWEQQENPTESLIQHYRQHYTQLSESEESLNESETLNYYKYYMAKRFPNRQSAGTVENNNSTTVTSATAESSQTTSVASTDSSQTWQADIAVASTNQASRLLATGSPRSDIPVQSSSGRAMPCLQEVLLASSPLPGVIRYTESPTNRPRSSEFMKPRNSMIEMIIENTIRSSSAGEVNQPGNHEGVALKHLLHPRTEATGGSSGRSCEPAASQAEFSGGLRNFFIPSVNDKSSESSVGYQTTASGRDERERKDAGIFVGSALRSSLTNGQINSSSGKNQGSAFESESSNRLSAIASLLELSSSYRPSENTKSDNLNGSLASATTPVKSNTDFNLAARFIMAKRENQSGVENFCYRDSVSGMIERSLIEQNLVESNSVVKTGQETVTSEEAVCLTSKPKYRHKLFGLCAANTEADTIERTSSPIDSSPRNSGSDERGISPIAGALKSLNSLDSSMHKGITSQHMARDMSNRMNIMQSVISGERKRRHLDLDASDVDAKKPHHENAPLNLNCNAQNLKLLLNSGNISSNLLLSSLCNYHKNENHGETWISANVSGSSISNLDSDSYGIPSHGMASQRMPSHGIVPHGIPSHGMPSPRISSHGKASYTPPSTSTDPIPLDTFPGRSNSFSVPDRRRSDDLRPTSGEGSQCRKPEMKKSGIERYRFMQEYLNERIPSLLFESKQEELTKKMQGDSKTIESVINDDFKIFSSSIFRPTKSTVLDDARSTTPRLPQSPVNADEKTGMNHMEAAGKSTVDQCGKNFKWHSFTSSVGGDGKQNFAAEIPFRWLPCGNKLRGSRASKSDITAPHKGIEVLKALAKTYVATKQNIEPLEADGKRKDRSYSADERLQEMKRLKMEGCEKVKTISELYDASIENIFKSKCLDEGERADRRSIVETSSSSEASLAASLEIACSAWQPELKTLLRNTDYSNPNSNSTVGDVDKVSAMSDCVRSVDNSSIADMSVQCDLIAACSHCNSAGTGTNPRQESSTFPHSYLNRNASTGFNVRPSSAENPGGKLRTSASESSRDVSVTKSECFSVSSGSTLHSENHVNDLRSSNTMALTVSSSGVKTPTNLNNQEFLSLDSMAALLRSSISNDYERTAESSRVVVNQSVDHAATRDKRCDPCGISFDDAALYSIHMNCHSHQNPFSCGLCGLEYGSKYDFYEHISRTHRVV